MKGILPLLSQFLYHRGITEPSEVESFLTADSCLQGDPFNLPDIDKAQARVYHALLSGENIAIYGDFDADGICGTALLIQGLSLLGGKVTPYIPHRLKEGYGLSLAALEGLYQQGVTLVITVDCGITAISEVAAAQKMKLDIIITDHHITPPILPQACAVVNPKREDSAYPFSQLSGVGVAFKFVEALFRSLGKEKHLDQLLDLVAIGTIADMVPLVGENRYLVKQGLQVLNQTRRLGLQALIHLAGLGVGSLDTESVSWILAPRLNAAGRLDHALTSYRLLVTDSQQEAQLLAEELEQKNAERRRLTEEVLAKAREKLLISGTEFPLLVVGGEDFPAGIVGLVAAKLVDEFYRPTLVFELGQSVSQGSARSIPEFDIITALRECQDLFLRLGGHPMAAGFTLPTKNLPYLEQRLKEIATKQLSGVDLEPSLTIEADIPLSALGGETFNMIQRLAPFGYSNPVPTFLSREVKVIDCKSCGSKGEHLRLKVRQGDTIWYGIGFGLSNLAAEVTPYIDIVYNLGVDQWGDKEMLELNILDFAPSNQPQKVLQL
jgi:single-stranded-DNA-specific exonuclease